MTWPSMRTAATCRVSGAAAAAAHPSVRSQDFYPCIVPSWRGQRYYGVVRIYYVGLVRDEPSDPAAMPRMHAAASVAAVLLVTFGEGLASARNVHGEGQHSMHEVVDVLNFEGANVCSLDTTPCATLGVVTTMNKCVDGSS